MAQPDVEQWAVPRLITLGVATAAVAVALRREREVAVSLVILAIVFVGFERCTRRVTFGRRESRATDIVHFLCDEMLAAPVVVAAAWAITRAAALPAAIGLHDLTNSQPFLVSLVTACAVGELGAYTGHVLLHRVRWLWRCHALHHSITKMDWLAPSRHHPLDLAFLRLSVAAPLMLLGFSVPSLGAPFVLRRIPGLIVHANTRLRLGRRSRWLITTPEFHHWHHAADARYHNKNFAGSLPIIDRLFGTLHFGSSDTGYWPDSYGVDETMPTTWCEQMLWPFRRRTPASNGASRRLRPQVSFRRPRAEVHVGRSLAARSLGSVYRRSIESVKPFG